MNKYVRGALPSLVAVPVGFGLTVLGTKNAAYSWPLFLGVPFLMGFIGVLFDRQASLWSSMVPLLVSSVMLLVWKIEGVICILMAAPLAIPLALTGGWIAKAMRGKTSRVIVTSGLMMAVPFGVVTAPHGPQPVDFEVSTNIIINVPPEIVWHFVTAFPDLAPADETIFRAGVAAPMGTSIDGTGIGAARRCVLSTGVMQERVTVWDPPRRLRFDVLSTPPAMKELSPYKDLDPPHLHGFYISKHGEFKLRALPGGKTLLTGTSWYQHGLQPAEYWRLWSDYVVHTVHRRVLTHIKHLAEERDSILLATR